MKKWIFLFLLMGRTVFAVDGVYLGGHVGNVGLLGAIGTLGGNTLGGGIDLGVRTNAIADVMLAVSHSAHNNDIGVTTLGLAAEFQLGPISDFGAHLDFGPVFKFSKNAIVNQTFFGVLIGAGGDLWLDDAFRLGLNLRYHTMFSSSNLLSGDIWSVMFRFGYLFEM